jgi:hypothetical protein
VVEISGLRIKEFAELFVFALIILKGMLVAECPVDKTSPIRLAPFPIVIESEQKVPVLSLAEPT